MQGQSETLNQKGGCTFPIFPKQVKISEGACTNGGHICTVLVSQHQLEVPVSQHQRLCSECIQVALASSTSLRGPARCWNAVSFETNKPCPTRRPQENTIQYFPITTTYHSHLHGLIPLWEQFKTWGQICHLFKRNSKIYWTVKTSLLPVFLHAKYESASLQIFIRGRAFVFLISSFSTKHRYVRVIIQLPPVLGVQFLHYSWIKAPAKR